MPPVRVSLALNAGPLAGQPQAALVTPADGAKLLASAASKLRLKKKDVAKARLFVWRSGAELPREGSLDGLLKNDDLVAVSLGEPYAGPGTPSAAAAAASSSASWLKWEGRSASLAVVEWSDSRSMNDALGRMSTLLEHPTLCAAEAGAVVSHDAQRSLPSASYLGHNLYSETLTQFEALAGADASAAEASFITLWRSRGAPAVVVSFVEGALSTLAHEMCHARYALDGAYRQAVLEEWAAREGDLGRWMRDLGYHHSRHADEFGAYVLTEPHGFWRGRVADAAAVRAKLLRVAEGERAEELASRPACGDVLELGTS